MNDVVWSLASVSDLWLDPLNPLREETIQALQVSTALSRRAIELAISNCFEELSAPKITAYIADWGQSPISTTLLVGDSPQSQPKRILHVLPSNAFTAWVHGAVTTLLLRHKLFLKPSIHEPVFANAWKRSIAHINPRLAEHVEIVPWNENRLMDYQAVIAYGSDETLQEIKLKLSPPTVFIGYGHKLSVGIIFQEAVSHGLSEALLERVRRDAEPFRLQGCLSPQILYMEDAHITRWPALDSSLDVAPKIKALAQWGQILNDLIKFKPYLSCAGFAGHPNRAQFLERELKGLGVSRICPIGEMQRPPLSWQNGGLLLPDLLH
jgi:hypothetical protein